MEKLKLPLLSVLLLSSLLSARQVNPARAKNLEAGLNVYTSVYDLRSHYRGGSWEYLVEQTFFGLAGGLGLAYRPCEVMSFNLESSFEYFLAHSNDLKSDLVNRYSRFAIFNPLQVSVGLRF